MPEEHKHGNFYSWEIAKESVAIKHTDISFFEHNGSGLPKEIKWFFSCESLEPRESKPIVLLYLGQDYHGRINCDSRGSCRVFWSPKLGKMFQRYYSTDTDDLPQACFERVSSDRYKVSFVVDED